MSGWLKPKKAACEGSYGQPQKPHIEPGYMPTGVCPVCLRTYGLTPQSRVPRHNATEVKA